MFQCHYQKLDNLNTFDYVVFLEVSHSLNMQADFSKVYLYILQNKLLYILQNKLFSCSAFYGISNAFDPSNLVKRHEGRALYLTTPLAKTVITCNTEVKDVRVIK